jgi:hypothetical protein
MSQGGDSHQAIVFYDGGDIIKQMLFPEFEAVLDQYVGMTDFASQHIHAAYVEINPQLKIVGATFFLIDFDAKGYVGGDWNIPLIQLTDNAGSGPDLGAGPIKMACRSSCSVVSQQAGLWDPDQAQIGALHNAIEQNLLSLPIYEPPAAQPEPVPMLAAAVQPQLAAAVPMMDLEAVKQQLRQQLEAEFDSRLSSTLDSALKQKEQEELALGEKNTQLKESLDAAKAIISDEKTKNRLLKETLDNQANELHLVRERFQQQLTRSESINEEQLILLQEQFEAESLAMVDAKTKELKERLEMRDSEIFLRDEKNRSLRQELEDLKRHQTMMAENEENLLDKMVNNGIVFIAEYPSGDQLTIPLTEINRYLDSPLRYMAEQAGVDTEIFRQWIYHCELPVCTAQQGDGQQCGKRIPKVDKPKKFMPGESDRCSSHRASSGKLEQLMGMRSSV